jgi:hypothetical protein
MHIINEVSGEGERASCLLLLLLVVVSEWGWGPVQNACWLDSCDRLYVVSCVQTWQHLIGFLAAQAKDYKQELIQPLVLSEETSHTCLLETGLP